MIDVSKWFGNGIKSVEKLALYVLGILESTNVVTIHGTSKDVVLAIVGGILASLHLSTTKIPN